MFSWKLWRGRNGGWKYEGNTTGHCRLWRRSGPAAVAAAVRGVLSTFVFRMRGIVDAVRDIPSAGAGTLSEVVGV